VEQEKTPRRAGSDPQQRTTGLRQYAEDDRRQKENKRIHQSEKKAGKTDDHGRGYQPRLTIRWTGC